MTLAPNDSVGPYLLEEVIADNGYVQVFRARREPPSADGDLVALKVVEADAGDSEVLRRFEREARVSQRVRHPNLVPVLEVGEADRVRFIAMRFVGGRALARVIEEDGPLAFDAVVRVVEEAGAALDALHRAGVVHRDVRSSNVMIGEDGSALLTDFGFARSQEDTRITDVHRPVGALDYRAPELFLGGSANRASDMYSLGCLVYECVVGAPPFAHHRDVMALGEAHLGEEPVDPVEKRPDTPPEFARAVVTALAKEPGLRPPSAAAYAKLLRFGLPRG
jgi:serine/threonine protein kinase